MTGMLFFGVWTGDRAGHYLYDQRGRPVQHDIAAHLPWPTIDGRLQPNARKDPFDPVPLDKQVEGQALLHHLDGWTALCFWDRSEDMRGGCNSNFFVEGTYDFAEMARLAREAFPSIWDRFTFEVHQ